MTLLSFPFNESRIIFIMAVDEREGENEALKTSKLTHFHERSLLKLKNFMNRVIKVKDSFTTLISMAFDCLSKSTNF